MLFVINLKINILILLLIDIIELILLCVVRTIFLAEIFKLNQIAHLTTTDVLIPSNLAYTSTSKLLFWWVTQ